MMIVIMGLLLDFPLDLLLASSIQPEIMNKYTSWVRGSCFPPSMEKEDAGPWEIEIFLLITSGSTKQWTKL
jgi:hypothetical protein